MESKKPPFDDDPDAPPSAEELAASARLRDALEDPSRENEDAELARALSLAYEPRALDPAEHKAIVDRVLRERRGVVIRVLFGASALVAAAAVVLLAVQFTRKPPALPELAMSRTTQPLFEQKFELGERSARIDRIASARSADLRNNHFARWGVPAMAGSNQRGAR
jgi:hypothetical protein